MASKSIPQMFCVVTKLVLFLAAISSAYGASWTQIGRPGGWIPSIVFHPTHAGEIWASGDDCAGIYRSTDNGNTWKIFNNTPANQSTYSLTIDPSNPSNIYAPNHFGRGMLLTRDAGNTWVQSVAGLPSPNTPGDGKLIYGTAVNPRNSAIVFVAAAAGLFKSSDMGNNFSQVNPSYFSGETNFRAVAFSRDGAFVLVASSNGMIFMSSNQGISWTQVVPKTGVPITTLMATSHAVYGVFANLTLVRIAGPNYNSFTANMTGINGGLKVSMAVASGNSPSTDWVYLASSNDGGANTGFFQSTNNGQTFTKRITGLQANSIYTIAVSPTAPETLIASTLGNGLFLTTNGGRQWIASSNQGLFAGTSTGLAQDPRNSQHLIVGDGTGSTGGSFGVSYETFNGGNSWSLIGNPALNVNAFVYDIDPQNSSVILAGTFNSGAYRSTGGSGGPWAQVIKKAVRIERVIREKANSQNVYAVATGPDNSPDALVYYSSDNGATFAQQPFFAFSLAAHPANSGEAIGLFLDAYATQNQFSSVTSLGLQSFAPSEGGFTAVAFDPSTPTTVVVGGATGGLYLTNNYSGRPGVTLWSKIPSPVKGTFVRDIVIVARADGGRDWYVTSFGASTNFNSATTSGVFFSSDGGNNWSPLASGLFPCSIVWRFFQSSSDPTQFYGAMWSGGVLKLK